MRWFPVLLVVVGLGLTTPAFAADGDSCKGDYGTNSNCLYLIDGDEENGAHTLTMPTGIKSDWTIVVELSLATNCTAGTVLLESSAGSSGLYSEVASTTTASSLTLDGSGVTRVVLTYPPGARLKGTITNTAGCDANLVDVIVTINEPTSAN